MMNSENRDGQTYRTGESLWFVWWAMLNLDDSEYWSKLTELVLSCATSARLPPLRVGQLRQEKHRVWPDHSQKVVCW